MNNKIVCIGFAFLMVSGIALAQPFEKFKAKPHVMHVRPVIVGSGFAITGEEYHVVFLGIVQKKNLPPGWAREYIKENNLKGLLENLKNASTEYRGRLFFAGDKYILKNIEANRTYLDADIFSKSGNSSNVGHITINIERYENAIIGVGELTINGEDYKVLLNIRRIHYKHKHRMPRF